MNSTKEVEQIVALRASFDVFRDDVFDEIKNLTVAQVRLEQRMTNLTDAVEHVSCLRDDKFNDIDRRLADNEEDINLQERSKLAAWWRFISIAVAFAVTIGGSILAFGDVRSTATSNKANIVTLTARHENVAPRMTKVETRQESITALVNETKSRLEKIEDGISVIRADVSVLKERNKL